MAVPQVAVDVVGQLGREGQEDQPREDGDSPDDEEGGGPAPGREARGAVTEEGGCGEEEAGKGHREPVQPTESCEECDDEEAREQDACPGITTTFPVLPSQIRSSRWVSARLRRLRAVSQPG